MEGCLGIILILFIGALLLGFIIFLGLFWKTILLGLAILLILVGLLVIASTIANWKG